MPSGSATGNSHCSQAATIVTVGAQSSGRKDDALSAKDAIAQGTGLLQKTFLQISIVIWSSRMLTGKRNIQR